LHGIKKRNGDCQQGENAAICFDEAKEDDEWLSARAFAVPERMGKSFLTVVQARRPALPDVSKDL
jgi:hypothetical protein